MLIPKENQKDLADIPAIIAKQLEIELVDNMDEVLTHSLILREGDTLFKNTGFSLAHYYRKQTMYRFKGSGQI